MESNKSLASLFREHTSRAEGIALCCVVFIAVASLAGHAIDNSELTNWSGPWSLTIPTAALYLLLALQYRLKTNLANWLVGSAVLLGSGGTLYFQYEGYSPATTVVQACLAISCLARVRSKLRLVAVPALWISVLELATLVLDNGPGPFALFLRGMSHPTAICGGCLAYLAITASEPYAFRRPTFRPKHLFYTLWVTTGLALANFVFTQFGANLSGAIVASFITAFTLLGIFQRFENRRLNNRHRDLLETLDKAAIVVITDPLGRIVHLNESFTKTYGFTPDEALGKSHSLVASGQHGDPFGRELWSTIKSGATWKGQICNKTKSGELVWLDATISPLPDERGAPELYLAIYFDITERINYEASLRQSRDKQSSMLESIQRMTAHRDRLVQLIAHDLRSPLATVIGIAEAAKLDGAKSATDTIARMTYHTRKALAELEDFLTTEEQLQTIQESALDQSFDPKLELLEEWQNHSLIALQKEISLEMPSAEFSSPVVGPRHLFAHIARNLLSNAVKHTPHRGRISIDLEENEHGLTLSVDDSGPGIPADKRGKIFTPFKSDPESSRKQSAVRSRGIGLSVVYDLLKERNGILEVHDSPLGGARLTAFIPRSLKGKAGKAAAIAPVSRQTPDR